MMAAVGRSLARAARDGARAALASCRSIEHRAAEGRGRVARFSALTGPPGSIGPIGPDKLPIYVDWMKFGAVTPVQDQGDCGACWAFATTGLIEAANFLYTKELVKLSEQHLIDANNIRNKGCEGGSIEEALQYVIRNGGILLDKDYPYTGVQGPAKHITAYGVSIDGHFSNAVSETALKRLVASSPVAAALGADASFLDHGRNLSRMGKVLDGPNYTCKEMRLYDMQHGVLIVGYGETTLGEKFWLVKNSHGGELMLIARDNGKIGGAFGIARWIKCVRKSNPNGLVTED